MVIFQLVFNQLLVLKLMDSLVEILTATLALHCFWYTSRKFKETRKKASFYLSVMFLGLAIAPLMQFMDGLFYTGWGPENTFGLYDTQYGYALIILSTSIMNICIYLFASDIFFNKKEGSEKKFSISSLILLVLSVSILVSSIFGFFMKLANQDVTIVIGLFMALSMGMNIFLGTASIKLAKSIENNFYSKSLMYIAYFAFGIIIVYVFFILDSFYSSYSIWGLFGWTLFLIVTYLAYKGFVAPMKVNIIKKEM